MVRTRLLIVLVVLGAAAIAGALVARHQLLAEEEGAPLAPPTAEQALRATTTSTSTTEPEPIAADVAAAYCATLEAEFAALHAWNGRPTPDEDRRKAEAAERVAAVAPPSHREHWLAIAAGYATTAAGMSEAGVPAILAMGDAAVALEPLVLELCDSPLP